MILDIINSISLRKNWWMAVPSLLKNMDILIQQLKRSLDYSQLQLKSQAKSFHRRLLFLPVKIRLILLSIMELFMMS